MDENYRTRNLGSPRLSRRRLFAGAAVAGVGLLVACSRNENKKPSEQGAASSGNVPKGGTLTQTSIATDAKSFHPYTVTDEASLTYIGYVYGVSLTQRDPKTLDLISAGADHWTVSADNKTFTFTLKDIKWTDGTPVTADDFVWSYQQAIKPENKYPYAENLDKIASYKATDPKTLVVTLNDALVIGLELCDSITPLPRHVWEKYPWSDPTKNPEILNPTVTSGMWKLKEWKKDDHATFVANETYFDGRPNIDTMTVRVFGTFAVAYQALKSGEVDYSHFQAADYKAAKQLKNVTVIDYYPAQGDWGYLGFNLRHPVVQDIRVRRAIAYATDRKGIIDSVLFGLAKPIYAGFAQESPAYNANVEHYDFNLDKSKDLLKQAGYTLDSNKKLGKDGKQLSLKLLYPSSSKNREGIATVLKQQLTELGINLDVQPLEFQAYIAALGQEPFDWDVQLGAWSSSIDPYWAYQFWSEKSIPELNPGAYVNKPMEQLFTQASKEFDKAKRRPLYDQIQQMLANDLPNVFIYEPLTYVGLNKKVGGIVPSPIGIEYNMNKWYINK